MRIGRTVIVAVNMIEEGCPTAEGPRLRESGTCGSACLKEALVECGGKASHPLTRWAPAGGNRG